MCYFLLQTIINIIYYDSSPCRTLATGASTRYAVAWRVVAAGPGDRIAIFRAHEPDAARLGELADAVVR